MHRLLLSTLALLIYSAVALAQPGPTVKASPTPAVATPNAAPDCGCESAPLPDVLAVVNGVKITKQDLSAETQARIAELQAQVVAARKRELDLQINSLLLEAEAKRLKLSTYQLLENEVVAKAPEPTEADAQAFYNQNKARISGEFASVKGDIIGYLRDERQREQARKLSERLRAAANVQMLVPEATPPASAAERARVFASVNGQRITSTDIEDSLAPLIFSVQARVYDLRKQDLDLKINDILLASEAQKQQVTSRALLDREVETKVPAVTEAQAQAFYNENKERINGEFAQVKDQVMQYLKETEMQRLRLAYAERLRQAAAVQVFLVPPVPPTYKIATDNQPAKGSANAAVTIVEFTDYQCPSCAETQPVLERLVAEYGDRVRLVVRDFPLAQHKQAFKAAEAAEAARAQGKYWEYAALLFANQSALEVNQLKEYASRLQLDRARFDAALDSEAVAEEVRRDLRDGDRVGVAGTPTIFVNGRRVADRSYEALKAAIEAALKTAATR
ncbi:MAG TPA: thioredoxin domain-containing protein [Pyrinomonadaceae bacterium]